MASKKLTVKSIKQYQDEWCGPACAHMILLSKEKLPNVSSDADKEDIQDALFSDIQANTGVGRGGFPITESSQGKTIQWETFPTALHLTMNARIGKALVTLHDDGAASASTRRVVRSVNGGIAPAVLTQDSTHWMVVFGWDDKQRRRSPLPEIVVDGQKITHLFLRDPAWSFPAQFDLDGWTAIQYKVEVGQFLDTFVVVGAP